MASITVQLPDHVYSERKAKLQPHGYSVEQFVESSLHSVPGTGSPLSPDLERKLPEALDSPLIDAADVD